MINFHAFKEIAESTAQYHKDLLVLENNLDVSMESNWMTRIMDSNIHALSRAFHPDKDFEGFCYLELTHVQVEQIEDCLQYLIYTWECGESPPTWVVYERHPIFDPVVKRECHCLKDAYEIIVDYVEHFQDDTVWNLEAV